MKKLSLAIIFVFALSIANAQNPTVFTPYGSVGYSTNGNVGIGTSSPASYLHVKGEIRSDSGTDFMKIGSNESGNYSYLLFGDDSNQDKLHFQFGQWVNNQIVGTTLMTLLSNGNLGVGTTSPDYKLDVNGTIRAEEVIVEDVGADFVFEDGYKLRSLKEVEQFIKEHKHLPDVAPASETEKGVKLGAFNETLLQKIEELTLYVIRLEKYTEELEKKINELKEVK